MSYDAPMCHYRLLIKDSTIARVNPLKCSFISGDTNKDVKLLTKA